MAEAGVKTVDLPASSSLDEIIGSQTVDGIRRTRRSSVSSVAMLLAADPAIAGISTAAAQLVNIERSRAMAAEASLAVAIDGATAGLVSAASWAALSATAGTRVGQPGRVIVSDIGTHTDPVVGGTVRNAGEYTWSGSAWRRLGDLESERIDEGLLTINRTIGSPVMSPGDAGLSGNHWVVQQQVESRGYLANLSLHTNSTNLTMWALILRFIGGSLTVVEKKQITTTAVGPYTFGLNMRVEAGDYVGVQTPVVAGIGSIAWVTGNPGPSLSFWAGTSDSFVPGSTLNVTARLAFQLKLTDPSPRRLSPLSVQIVGTALYIRTRYNEASDLVIQGSTLHGGNVIFDGIADRLIPRTTPPSLTATAFATGKTLKSTLDDAAPIRFAQAYLGGNHGIPCPRIQRVGHGKANVDIGSIWAGNSTGRRFVLYKIVGDFIWFLAEPGGTATLWTDLQSSIAAGDTSLVHVSGATNTAAITIDARISDQAWPSLQNYRLEIELDGTPLAMVDGVYGGQFLRVIDSYGIGNPRSAVDYLKGRTGSSAQGAINVPAIQTQVRVRQTRTFNPEGACTLVYEYEGVQEADIGYIGATQSMALEPEVGEKLYLYIPRAGLNPETGLTPSQVVDLTGISTTMTIDAAEWVDANDPPERFVQIIKTAADVPKHGFITGYSKRIGDTVPATRKDQVAAAFFTPNSTKKMYPRANGDGIRPAGTMLTIVAYRAHFDPALDPMLTSKAIYTEGAKDILVLDTHQVLNRHWVALPSRLIGKEITVFDKSAGLTLHSSIVGGRGVAISNGAGIGELIAVIS